MNAAAANGRSRHKTCLLVRKGAAAHPLSTIRTLFAHGWGSHVARVHKRMHTVRGHT